VTITGAPDFQAYAQWRQLSLLAGYSQVLPAGHTRSGAQLVSSWRGVQVRVVPSVGFCAVTVSWFDDAAETSPVGADSWNVGVGQVLSVVVPAKGHYCDLDINNVSGGAMTAATALMPVNGVTDRLAYPVGSNFLAFSGRSVPASTTQLVPLPLIQAGPATLNWSFGDVNGFIALAVVRLTPSGGLGDVLADLGSATVTTPFTQQVSLTDDSCGLRLVNSDAAGAHTINVRLVATGR
jgi:hypothetical protein